MSHSSSVRFRFLSSHTRARISRIVRTTLPPLRSFLGGKLRSSTTSSQGVVVISSSSSGAGRGPAILLSSYVLEKKMCTVIVYGDASPSPTAGGSPTEKSVVLADTRQARKTCGPDSMMRSREERSSRGVAAIGDSSEGCRLAASRR